MSSPPPLLRFNDTPFHAWEHGIVLSQLQERGFAVVSDVFDPASVDAFRAQALAEIAATGLPEDEQDALPDASPLRVHAIRAPRIRQALQRTLSPTFPPFPIMLECVWITKTVPPQGPDAGWHKDYDFEYHMAGRCQYPPAVAVSMYFEDMGEGHGATEIVPGSHRDPERSPYRGSPRLVLTPRKQDAVIWDQRMWHRATTRQAPGRRTMAIYGFYPSPILENHSKPMSLAQEQAWLGATSEEDRIFFGGIFKHPSQRSS